MRLGHVLPMWDKLDKGGCMGERMGSYLRRSYGGRMWSAMGLRICP